MLVNQLGQTVPEITDAASIARAAAVMAADLTGDGVVDTVDLLALLAAWGPCAGCVADPELLLR